MISLKCLKCFKHFKLFRMKQLESNFEDDVTVTTIRKVTEFSVDECRSMKSSHNVKHADQDVYNGGLVEDVKIETDVKDAVVEENAIFEHESSLYGGVVFNNDVR